LLYINRTAIARYTKWKPLERAKDNSCLDVNVITRKLQLPNFQILDNK
jgi:hypothetical protein